MTTNDFLFTINIIGALLSSLFILFELSKVWRRFLDEHRLFASLSDHRRA